MTSKNTGNMPEKKFSTGVISATIWKNQGQAKDGKQTEFRTISLQRRYKDKEGNWQSTNSMRINDLPKASLVLNKAYEYLVIREDEASASSDIGDIEEEIIM